MRDSPCRPLPLRLIVAAFTNAQRVVRGLDERAGARAIGIRINQLRAAEAGRRIKDDAFARLIKFNNLEGWADG